jgi:hypothetical protein
MAKTNTDIAIEMQGKFELYMLGLIFTVLGLSIQTAKFGNSTAADMLELLGWLSLFVSGVTGLLRGEWIPVLYRIGGKIESTERRIAEIEQALAQGIDVPVTFIENGAEHQVPGPEAVQKLRAAIAELEKQQSDGEGKITRRYNCMKAALFIGLAFLMAARSYEPIKALFTGGYPGLHL